MKSEKSVETRSEQIKYAEIVYRSIDAELRDYQKILQRLSSTLSPYSNNLPEPVAKYIVAQIRDDLERWRRTHTVVKANLTSHVMNWDNGHQPMPATPLVKAK